MDDSSPPLPIPVTITVRHLTPVYHPLMDGWDEQEKDSTEPKCIDYHLKRQLHTSTTFAQNRGMYPSSDYFFPIRIDLMIPSNYLKSIISHDSKDHFQCSSDESSSVILASYCNHNLLSTCNVVWDHVDETLYDTIAAIGDQYYYYMEREQKIQEIWTLVYPNLSVRVSISQHSKINHGDDHDPFNSFATNHPPFIQLCSIPLYPPNLSPIFEMDSYTKETSSCTLPNFIPPNSIFVLYSDGMTRVHSSFYSLENLNTVQQVCPVVPISHSYTISRKGSDNPTVLYKPMMGEAKGEPLLDDDMCHHEHETEENKILLESEMEFLETQLFLEQKLYNQDIELRNMTCQILQSLPGETTKILDETKDIQNCLETLRPLLDQNYRNLHKQQVMLISELRSIYPIQQFPDQVYLIGGIHLPSDLYSLVSSDEMISTALGSAIQDETHRIIPLFKDPMVDRDQMDMGLKMLHQNIDLLFTMSGFPIMENHVHVLFKVDTFLSGICCGEALDYSALNTKLA